MKKSQKSDPHPPPFPRCARSHKQKPQLSQEGGFLQTKKDKGRQQVKQASLPNKRSFSPARSPSSVEVPFCSFSKFCLSPRGGVKANFLWWQERRKGGGGRGEKIGFFVRLSVRPTERRHKRMDRAGGWIDARALEPRNENRRSQNQRILIFPISSEQQGTGGISFYPALILQKFSLVIPSRAPSVRRRRQMVNQSRRRRRRRRRRDA